MTIVMVMLIFFIIVLLLDNMKMTFKIGFYEEILKNQKNLFPKTISDSIDDIMSLNIWQLIKRMLK